jgi:hypothetical protein
VCVSVCLSVCLSGYTFPHFSSDLLQIWREPSTGHDTFRGLYMFCVHACEHVCARARVIKHSFIYGRILFKFAMNTLQVTWLSSMGYVLIIFTHHARTCDHASLKQSLIFGRILFKFAGHILQMTYKFHGINCSLIYGQVLSNFAVNILQITTSSKSCVHVHVHVCERARG